MARSRPRSGRSPSLSCGCAGIATRSAPRCRLRCTRTTSFPDTWRHPHQEIRTTGTRSTPVRTSPASSPGWRRSSRGNWPGPTSCSTPSTPPLRAHHHRGAVSCLGLAASGAADPAIRPLLSDRIPRAHTRVPARHLRALGIPLDDAVVIYPRDVIRVERLVAATPQFENPYYVDPDIQTVWRELLAGLPPAGRRPRPDLRAPRPGASASATRRRGSSPFSPGVASMSSIQRISIRRAGPPVRAGRDRGRLRREWHVHHAAGTRPRSHPHHGNGYNAENEHLIAAVNGNRLDYFWGVRPANIRRVHPARVRPLQLHFDLRQHRRSLERVLS